MERKESVNKRRKKTQKLNNEGVGRKRKKKYLLEEKPERNREGGKIERKESGKFMHEYKHNFLFMYICIHREY